MKKLLLIFVSVLVLTGFSMAVVGNDAPEGKPSITDTQGNQPGNVGEQPEDAGPPENVTGNKTGLSKAMDNAGGAVSENVLKPLSNGAQGLGQLFSFQNIFGGADENASAENKSDVAKNTSEQGGGFLGFIFGNAPENASQQQ